MKLLKTAAGAAILYLLLFSTGTQISSCTKTETIYDTVIIRDTIVDSLECSCYDLKDGLVAYYNFKGGNLNDSSGNNNHIVFNNATATADRFGKANSAYLFNGTSSYMRVANSTSLNPATAITLTAIVKPNAFYTGACKGNQIIAKNYSDGDNGMYLLRYQPPNSCTTSDISKQFFSGGYGNAASGNSTGAGTDTAKIMLGNWYHVVYTYESGISNLYMDGKLVSTVTKTPSFTANSLDLYIGRLNSSQYPYWLNGVIDEIRIYNKALCAGAVKQLYNQAD